MKIRIVTLLAAALLLSACTDQDWQHALSYTGMGGSQETEPQAAAAPPPAAAPPAPVAQAQPASPIPDGAQPAPNVFCQNVASQDAGRNDFDAATQQRVFMQSYQQCVTVFGGVTK